MREGSRAGPYLVLGAAAGALVGWLTFALARSIGESSGAERALVVALTLVALALAAAVLFSPFVRESGVALARPLLGVDLPTVRDRRSWDSRWHGVVWALWVMLLGVVAAVLLLALVPIGVLLIAGTSWPAALWQVPVGIGAVLAAFAVPCLLGRTLIGTAPRLLGPTAQDRLAEAQDRRMRLAQQNTLARELHDGIGHALTAIDVQAQAGLAGGAEQQARDALFRIRAATGRALGELDDLLGALRFEDDRIDAEVTEHDLVTLVRAAATGAPSQVEVRGSFATVTALTRSIVHRVVQEALTNAARHGRGPATVLVLIGTDEVTVTVENRIGAPAPGGGRGLLGMRERVRLAGGILQTDAREGRWRLVATLPR